MKKQEYVIKPIQETPLREIHSIEEIPRSPIYKLWINNKEQTVYHNEFLDFSIPVIKKDGLIKVEVKISKKYDTLVIRPKSRNIQYTVKNDRIFFTLSKPEKITIELDGDLLCPLYILCTRYVEKPEHVTHYFEKGKIYNIGTMRLKTDDTVYIEEGSIVCGRFLSRMANNITISGNGMLYGAVWHKWDENCADQMILLSLGENLHIEGISIVDGGSWHCVPVASKNITIHDINIISKVITGDGIDIVGCENVKITNCFIRTNDDCISLKGCEYQDPAGCCNIKNVLVEDCVFWNAEFGNTLEIGYETRCDEICNITFRNCDIVHCEYEGNQSGGVLTIHNADRALVHNIFYEDIRIEDAQEKLIDIKTLDSKYSRDRIRGEIKDIYFKNISVIDGAFPVSILRGYEMKNDLCRPHDIYFQNFIVHGEKIMSANQLRAVVELVDDLHFQ